MRQNIALDYLALYMVNKSDNLLERCGGFACEDSEHGARFTVGEGLVGQVALQGHELQVSEQQGHHLHVQTGLMRLPVQTIRIVPIGKADSVIAVLEVAAIRPLTTADQALISQVALTLADKLEILLSHLEKTNS